MRTASWCTTRCRPPAGPFSALKGVLGGFTRSGRRSAHSGGSLRGPTTANLGCIPSRHPGLRERGTGGAAPLYTTIQSHFRFVEPAGGDSDALRAAAVCHLFCCGWGATEERISIWNSNLRKKAKLVSKVNFQIKFSVRCEIDFKLKIPIESQVDFKVKFSIQIQGYFC